MSMNQSTTQSPKQAITCRAELAMAAGDFIESFCSDLNDEVAAWRCIAVALSNNDDLEGSMKAVKEGLVNAVKEGAIVLDGSSEGLAALTKIEGEQPKASDSVIDDVVTGYLVGNVSICDIRESVKTH